MKIDDEKIIEDIKETIDKYSDTSFKCYKQHGNFSECAVRRVVGKSWSLFLKKLGHETKKNNGVTKEVVVEDVLNIFKTTGCTTQENYISNGKYSRAIIKRLFGSWNKMLSELNIPINMYKPGMYDKESILQDYNKLKESFGRPLTAAEYRKYGKFSQPIIDKVFGSFSNLKRELKETIDGRFVSDEEVEEDIVKLYNTFGVLSQKLIAEESIVSYPTIIKKYGSLNELCSKLKIPYTLEDNKSKLFIQCLGIIKEQLGDQYTLEKTFPWLKNPNTGRPLFVDIFYENFKLAIEVDGDQHYRYTKWIHKTQDNFKKTKQRDFVKDALLKKHGYKIIRLRKPDIKEITEKLKDVI